MTSLGPQYSGDDAFKARARLHQSRFRVEQLRPTGYRKYGNRLTTADAIAGKNFCDWPGMLASVEQGYGRADTPLWHDMLRSEHIPFNIFVPLRDLPWAPRLFARWLRLDVAELVKVAIEWAPEPKAEYLNDNTSFDAYVECALADGRRAALGIEVKYTEGPYAWGKTERARMFDESSPYHRIHERAQLYIEGALDALRTRELKQIWRNQLLGEALRMKPGAGIEEFVSVLLYPKGNEHYAKAASAHMGLIVPDRRRTFLPVTFERLIEESRELAGADAVARDWLDYLEQRYLVR